MTATLVGTWHNSMSSKLLAAVHVTCCAKALFIAKFLLSTEEGYAFYVTLTT